MGPEELVCRSQFGVLGLLRALFLHGGALWSCRRFFCTTVRPRNPFTVIKMDSDDFSWFNVGLDGKPRDWFDRSGQLCSCQHLHLGLLGAMGFWRSGRVGSFSTEDIPVFTKTQRLTV